ncbi:MAG: type 4a pilus biogenesis protein PilO [Phycisphaeraceae bacterium]
MKASTITDRGTLPLHVGGAVTCATLLACGWFFGLGPLLTDTQQTAAVNQEYQHAQQAARESKDRLNKLEARLEDVRARLSQQPVHLESSASINPLLAELARWADEHGLSMTRTQAGRPVSLAYYDYVPISLAGEGAYPDLLGFMRQANHARGDLGVISFNAARMGAQGGVAFQLELAWYVVSDEAQGAPATAAVPAD